MYFVGMKNLFLLLLLCCAGTTTIAQTSQKKDSARESYITFQSVAYEAQFPGGLSAWQQYLLQNIRFDKIMPLVPKNVKHWEETAVLQFIVEKDGSIHQIKVINPVSKAVEDEAIRIVSVSPKWQPAMQNGKKVRAWKKQPITFVVQGE